jgi:diguanylate cyclase (GGDEF)-like protein
MAETSRIHRALASLIEHLEGWPPRTLTLAALVLVAMFAGLDDLAGPSISLFVLYLIPIGIVAWVAGRQMAWLVVTLSTAVVFFDAQAGSEPEAELFPTVWSLLTTAASFLVVAHLVAAQREAFNRVRRMALCDELTGLANRRGFVQSVEAALARARRSHKEMTVVYFDCDNFKTVNDRFGHAAGDTVLRAVAATLMAQTRATDAAARLGGDEFGVLLPDADEAAGRAVVQKVREALLAEMQRGGWPVTFSIGAVTYRAVPSSAGALLHRVDALQYAVKRGGKDGIRFETVGAAVLAA